jgi:DNA-binding transcriptional ArsR family regulator
VASVNADSIFKALANGSRRKLLDILCERNGQNLGELCEHLNTSRQAVMQHLAILEDANLITVVWDGRQKLHYLNPVPIQETYGRWVSKFERHRLHALDSLKQNLEAKERRSKWITRNSLMLATSRRRQKSCGRH